VSKEPLYPRVLRLRHLHPSGWQRLLFWEGSFVVAALLVLADLASAWTLLVLPLAVALVVKANDLLLGLLRVPAPSTAAAVPAFADLPAEARVTLTPEQAEAFAALTQQGLALAAAMLVEEQGFLPFACVRGRDGGTATVGQDLSAGQPMDRFQALEALHRRLAARSADFDAVAVLADAEAAGTGDAVLVELSHRAGADLLVVAPYTLAAGAVRFGTLSALPSAPTVFATG
jgi:hypothetical protein